MIHVHDMQHGPLISMKIGIIWLFVITLCISAMSDILVGTIDGFAERMNLSQVFTSMVIVPFFSNVAEQVSAFLFAYCNEMDLCVGVTIGSAIQIATFVLPGSVLIRTFMDIHSYETALTVLLHCSCGRRLAGRNHKLVGECDARWYLYHVCGRYLVPRD
jgi:calcium/proton exchanger cax